MNNSEEFALQELTKKITIASREKERWAQELRILKQQRNRILRRQAKRKSR